MAPSDSSSHSSSDSSKKVAKAAKAGATPSASVGREQRSLGFPMAMTGIIVLGTALVIFAWSGRNVDALTPSFADHWHLPYGLYDCRVDGFIPPFSDNGNPGSGIHTHMDASGVVGDGVVHLHPRSSTATGNNAQLARFMETVQGTLEGDEALSFPDRPALTEEGSTCNGEQAVLQVARFAFGGTEPVEIVTENLEDFIFEADQEPWVIALAPMGADIPPPEQSSIDGASAASPFVQTTDGLNDLTDLFGSGDGFDEDGFLIDTDGNRVLNDDGDEINIADFATDDADASHSGDDADADSDDE